MSRWCAKFSYMLLIPALAVSSLILGFNLLADGLREMSLKGLMKRRGWRQRWP